MTRKNGIPCSGSAAPPAALLPRCRPLPPFCQVHPGGTLKDQFGPCFSHDVENLWPLISALNSCFLLSTVWGVDRGRQTPPWPPLFAPSPIRSVSKTQGGRRQNQGCAGLKDSSHMETADDLAPSRHLGMPGSPWALGRLGSWEKTSPECTVDNMQ